MKKEWRNHREICETVFDSGTMPALLTQMEMKDNLSPEDFQAALGGDGSWEPPQEGPAKKKTHESGSTQDSLRRKLQKKKKNGSQVCKPCNDEKEARSPQEQAAAEAAALVAQAALLAELELEDAAPAAPKEGKNSKKKKKKR